MSAVSITTIELRGRDLIITSPTEWQQLSLAELLTTLFGPYLSVDVSGDMAQDKRGRFLRTKPIHFSAVKQALSQQQTPFSWVRWISGSCY